MSVPSKDDAERRLALVHQEIHDDPFWDSLREWSGINLVPGYGQTDPRYCRVLLVGEAPGATENARGRPFCGPSGRVLNILMREAGLRLDPIDDDWGNSGDGDSGMAHDAPANAYVTNVVKYRPPGNRTPTYLEIQHAKAALRKEWQALGGPKAIVCVGGVAHSALHPGASVLRVSAAAGRGFWPLGDNRTILFSQYHPAYGLRNGEGTQRMMTEHWRTMGEMLREEGIL